MIITFHDERRPEKPVVATIGIILGPRVQQFIPTSDVHIQYYAWNCVDNCVLPCFEWRRILNEKYEVTTAPKVYSLMTPDHDDQKLSVKIKSPIPLTIALLPSHLTDQGYDKTCSFNVANGTQTLLILPDITVSGNKKASVEVNTVKCVDHCDLLPPPPNP